MALRSAVIRSGSSSPISFRPSSWSAGDLPCFDDSRSGTIATNPSLASRSATVGSQSVSPKISWITMTAGRLVLPLGIGDVGPDRVRAASCMYTHSPWVVTVDGTVRRTAFGAGGPDEHGAGGDRQIGDASHGLKSTNSRRFSDQQRHRDPAALAVERDVRRSRQAADELGDLVALGGRRGSSRSRSSRGSVRHPAARCRPSCRALPP